MQIAARYVKVVPEDSGETELQEMKQNCGINPGDPYKIADATLYASSAEEWKVVERCGQRFLRVPYTSQKDVG